MHLQFLQLGSVVQFDGCRGGRKRLQRSNEIAGGWDREMSKQGGAVSPLLEKHQPQWILAIGMHGMRDAAGLPARAMDVLEAQFPDFVKTVGSSGHAAGHYDHLISPFYRLGRHGAE
jgi:hypothetical protein